MTILKRYGAQFAGPFLFLIIINLPTTLLENQQNFLAIFTFVVFSWLFSNIPLFITGFIGVTASVILNLAPANKLFANFGHPIIFLFLGGFLLAKAFSNVGLDKRISLYLLTRSFIKGSLSRLLFTLMLLTATFTMWISNTATTAMMLPLVLGTLASLKITNKKTISLILICIAYSSSIGGIATPIGSPPNMIAIGMLEELVNIKISFLGWMAYTLPMATLFMLILFFLCHKQISKEKTGFDSSFLINEFKNLPKISIYEIYTFIIFILTVILWLMPSLLKLASIKVPLNLNSGAVAMTGAALLFIFPLRSGRKILKSKDIKEIDWSSLMLFGAGLALGKLLFDLGLAQMASEKLISLVSHFGIFGVFFTVFTFVVFSTELTSNSASANILIPIMISMGIQLDINPLFISMGVAVACSLAFMLPVATPPNAIVYGSEMVEKTDMMKFGFALNLILAFFLTIIIYIYNLL
jgi:sodium-dependent dicarboxylate transporter 2/3/5